MASLTAHLRRPGEHGRLAFHPECPLCCGDRLAGPLPTDAVVGRRTQAFLAAGVLALSSATPAAALAGEPDQEQEGATAPDQAAAQAPPSAPDYDPGGGSTDVPVDAAPAPAPDARSAPGPAGDEAASPDPEATTDDAASPEQEAATDADAPVADAGDGTGPPTPAEQPAPSAQEIAATPPAPAPTTPQPTPEPAVSAPAPQTPTAEAPDTDDASPRGERKKPRSKDSPDAAPAVSAPAVSPPGSSAPSTMVVAETQPPAQSSPGPASRIRAAQPGDRFHVVAPGESLWSIAADVLGDGASVARTAREVNRLWELNRARIATGDPDLLMAGTRLALR